MPPSASATALTAPDVLRDDSTAALAHLIIAEAAAGGMGAPWLGGHGAAHSERARAAARGEGDGVGERGVSMHTAPPPPPPAASERPAKIIRQQHARVASHKQVRSVAAFAAFAAFAFP